MIAVTEPEATVRNFRIVRTEDTRQVTRGIDHYNLDAIISVGYRMKSLRATQFRQWGPKSTALRQSNRVIPAAWPKIYLNLARTQFDEFGKMQNAHYVSDFDRFTIEANQVTDKRGNDNE